MKVKLFNRFETDHTMVNFIIITLVMIIIALAITVYALSDLNGVLETQIEGMQNIIYSLQEQLQIK